MLGVGHGFYFVIRYSGLKLLEIVINVVARTMKEAMAMKMLGPLYSGVRMVMGGESLSQVIVVAASLIVTNVFTSKFIVVSSEEDVAFPEPERM